MAEEAPVARKNYGLLTFILRRLVAITGILLVTILAFFFFMKLAPGDFYSAYLMNPDVDQTLLQAKRAEFGLDQPFYVQFGLWIKNAVTKGDLGQSFSYRMPVTDLVLPRLANTLYLNLLSLFFAYAIAFPLSFYFAYRPRKWLDRGVDIATLLLYSAPSFFLALLALVFAANTGWFPINGATSPDHDSLSGFAKFADRLNHLWLPVIVGFLGGLAGSIRSMKVLLHEEFAKPYISAARARGLPGSHIVGHAFRNALVPTVTGLSDIFAGLVSGSLFVEMVFGYPGIGYLMYEATMRRDYFVVIADIVMVDVLVLLGILFSDILLALVDPRVRIK